ncbi:MAG: GDP-mannose 4,6-dehydratase [Candidatus Sungbacteria bacterium]|nr:GDP-mannose 4,6-dehydratase [bacterium]MDZ4260200.1 GDP-mannose 4,6-dehydratase [Candidatus Sungbacteria bacterium]
MQKRILITGGAGFIGTNTANYFLVKNEQVTIFDNLSRKGSEENLKWLKKTWGKRFTFVRGDVVYDRQKLDKLMTGTDVVIHLAAQVAVTTSVENPHHDFLVNAQGTLNVLEAIRGTQNKPMMIYASTNKVYGNLDHAPVHMTEAGYRYADYPDGIPAHAAMDFHSPYGCSKGTADQYVHDYARIYGLRTVVFRQSCIYGPHQFGVEDQGWVAWFAISGILSRPITIYGDGHQVRDVLYVDDLARLYDMAIKNPKKVSGNIYNIGGGAKEAFSVLQTIKKLESILKKQITHSFGNWRPGDQKVYISDISKITRDLGWEPNINFEKGLVRLVRWAEGEESTLKRLVG